MPPDRRGWDGTCGAARSVHVDAHPSDSGQVSSAHRVANWIPKVRTAVLAAALDELSERGYSAFTVENVAQRAGAHKTTVYRRWPDRDALAVDALAESVAAELPIPDTGSVDDDLRALSRSLVAWINSPSGRAVLAVMVSAAGLPSPPDAARHILRDRMPGTADRAVRDRTRRDSRRHRSCRADQNPCRADLFPCPDHPRVGGRRRRRRGRRAGADRRARVCSPDPTIVVVPDRLIRPTDHPGKKCRESPS